MIVAVHGYNAQVSCSPDEISACSTARVVGDNKPTAGPIPSPRSHAIIPNASSGSETEVIMDDHVARDARSEKQNQTNNSSTAEGFRGATDGDVNASNPD